MILFNGYIKMPNTTYYVDDVNLSVMFICETQKSTALHVLRILILRFVMSILPTQFIQSDPHHTEIYRLAHFINLQ